MISDVKFLKGTQEQYTQLEEKDQGTFYLIVDDESQETAQKVYLGDLELSNADIIQRINKIEQDIGTIENLKTTEKQTLVKAVNEIYDKIGDLNTLDAGAQDTVVAALNALHNEITSMASGKVVTVTKEESPEGLHAQYKVNQGGSPVDVSIDIDKITLESTGKEGSPKTYTLKQGQTEIGKIEIPKDLVVQSGSIIVVSSAEDPQHPGLGPGTYIELVLNDENESKIDIDVKSLIDVYTADNTGKNIEVTVSEDHKISASLGAGKVTSTELAKDAVETNQIKNEAVTEDKLATALKEKINKAGQITWEAMS